MALTSKYINIEEILEGIYIEAGYQSIDWAEAMFHVGRILSKMTTPAMYVEKITDGSEFNIEPLIVENFRTQLPRDLTVIKAVRDYDTKVSLIENNDLYFLNQNRSINYETSVPSDFEDVENVTTTKEYLNRVSPSYKLNDNYIFTNLNNIKLEVVYLAIPTDSRGYPLIPDDEFVKEAIEKYIIEKLDLKAFRQGKINQQVYRMSQQNSHWATSAAITHSNSPTVDQMQSIINSWMRMIPDMKSHSKGFISQNKAEKRWLH